MNRTSYIYCIDNLYKKYDISRYSFIKKKYGIIKNENLIFRFNRYSKKSYIIKLLKNFTLDENERYNILGNMILQAKGIKNYKRYIDNMFMNREIDKNMFIEIEFDTDKKKVYKNPVFKKVDNNFISGYSNCLTCICLGKRCRNHNLL